MKENPGADVAKLFKPERKRGGSQTLIVHYIFFPFVTCLIALFFY